MRTGLAAILVLTALLALLPAPARAQYKNSSFGLDVGYWLVTKPSVVDPATSAPYEGDRLPLRLENGLRLGGEGNVKLDDDHVWLTTRVDVGFLSYPAGSPTGTIDQRFDAEADRTLGTIVGIEGQMGLRYVFLTDRFRPYVQGSLSYLRLMTFNSLAGESCTDAVLCGGSDNEQAYLRHPNIGALHLQPGVEMVLERDFAIHLFVDIQRWLVLNASDNTSVVVGAGVLFFT